MYITCGCSVLASEYGSVATARFQRWVPVSWEKFCLKVASSYMCRYVGLKFERAFSTRSPPALKRSSPAQNGFFPHTKSVHLQCNKRVCLLFGRCFRKPPKKNRNQEKKVSQNFISVKDGAEGRHERTQEDYPTPAVYFCRCWVVFLRSFISALFLSFF